MQVVDTRTGKPVTLRAQGSNVFVRLDDRPDRLVPGGVIVTHDYSFVQPTQAIALSVGRDAPRDLKPGDRVQLGKFNGQRIEHLQTADGGQVWCMSCDYSKPSPHFPDIYAAVEP